MYILVLCPINCNRPEQFGERLLSIDPSFRICVQYVGVCLHTCVHTRTMARSMVRVGAKSNSNYHSAIPRCGVNWLSRAGLHSRAERTKSCGGLEHLKSSNKRLSERGERKGVYDPDRRAALRKISANSNLNCCRKPRAMRHPTSMELFIWYANAPFSPRSSFDAALILRAPRARLDQIISTDFASRSILRCKTHGPHLHSRLSELIDKF